MQLLLGEKGSLSFVVCPYENHRAKKTVGNARGRYKEIRPAQQPIKSLVLSLPYNKTPHGLFYNGGQTKCSFVFMLMSLARRETP